MAFIALLDANVIWSAPLRDTLLLAAEHGLYRPVWSLQILNEMARSLKEARHDLAPEKIERIVAQMQAFFPEAMIEGYEALIPAMSNDPGDRHVLAAAVRASAGVIVTENVKHFPPHACQHYDVDIQTADEFLSHLWHLSPETMELVLREQAGALRNPPQTVFQVLEVLKRFVPQFAATVLAVWQGTNPDNH